VTNIRKLDNPQWRCLPPQLLGQQLRLGEILLRWEGTPYRPGQQKRGGGVDCVRFVAAVLDELRGTKTEIKTLPNDAAMHTREGAVESMLTIKRAFMPCELVANNTLEPGDVLITGPVGGGPGHALIVGDQCNVLWESSGDGVRRVGKSTLKRQGTELFYAYRLGDREKWAAL
jgi:hypothetical protein